MEISAHEYDRVLDVLYYVLLNPLENIEVYEFLCFCVELRHVCRYSCDRGAVERGDFGCLDIVHKVCRRLYGSAFLVYVSSYTHDSAG